MITAFAHAVLAYIVVSLPGSVLTARMTKPQSMEDVVAGAAVVSGFGFVTGALVFVTALLR